MEFIKPRIGGHSDDLGPLVKLACSQCEAIRWFRLKRHSAFVKLVGVELSKTSAFSIHCAKCDFTIDLSAADAQKGIAFLPMAKQFETGKITEPDFLTKLDEADFQFYKEYTQANTNWTCRQCGEQSPLTFSSCWNCGTASENPDSSTEQEPEIKTPFLDQVLKNKGGPLGPINL